MITHVAVALFAAAAPSGEDPIAVVTELIPRGGRVDESRLKIVRRQDRKLKRTLIPHIWRSGERLRARRALRPGTVISKWDVEPTPDVSAKDLVIVEVVQGALRVTAEAMAKEDGFWGETIWVQNVKSKRRLRVRVTGPGRVTLERPTRYRR